MSEAAYIARKSAATLRQWASLHHIGRRVGGGDWLISYPALLMFLDGDDEALSTYLAGDREGEDVKGYFTRAAQQICAQNSQKAQKR